MRFKMKKFLSSLLILVILLLNCIPLNSIDVSAVAFKQFNVSNKGLIKSEADNNKIEISVTENIPTIVNMYGENVALKAKADAKYTNVYGVSTDKINDDQLATIDGITSWNSWGTDDYPMWVTLTWDVQYNLTGMEVLWWSDSGGVLFPESCYVEYLEEDEETWTRIDDVGVAHTNEGYNGANTEWNQLTFGRAITTTALRLQIERSADSYPMGGVGISEWRVYGYKYAVGPTKVPPTMEPTKIPIETPSPSGNGGNSGYKSDGGGILTLGEDVSGTSSGAAEFFPSNWSLKSCVFPIEISKEEKADGSYTVKGSVGIGKNDLLNDDSKWNKYKKNVSAANKYIGRFDCLNAYKDTWGVKSVTAITTDKFEILPQLSVMGYFENTYDKNGNLVSSDGKLAADAKWSGSISWQVITPIGPLYLNLSGSGKLSGKLGTEYDYKNKKLKIADGNLKFIPSVTIEGGYGIDKVATVGAQGTLSVPITIVPTSKGEFEAKAVLHVKLVFVIDYTHDLVDYKETIWDTTSKIKNIKKGNIIQISEEKFSEMDVSFDEASGKWNGGKINKQLRKLSKRISDAIVNNTITLQKGILPSSLPMQLQINNKNVMVFQAYDNSRTTLNSTVLKYSIFENGFWSEPKAVLDDGYADMFSDMKVINNKLVLVWQKVCKEIRGDVENDSKSVLKDIARNSEIYFSVFDEDTNTFVNPVKVTKNSQYDMMPRICSDSNDIIVSWVRNDAADLMQETGKNTIYTAKWNGSSFEEEVSLSQATGTIDEYVVYQNGESIQSVFVGQTSGIISVYGTDGHILTALSKLIFASYDGKISSLNYSDGQISCIANGKLYSYDIYSENVASGMAGNSAFASEVKYCSNGEKSGYIWSTYDEETDMGSIIASMKTETGYSEPITICKKEHVMWRYFYPIIDLEGNWQIVANALDTQTDLNSHLRYF